MTDDLEFEVPPLQVEYLEKDSSEQNWANVFIDVESDFDRRCNRAFAHPRYSEMASAHGETSMFIDCSGVENRRDEQ